MSWLCALLCLFCGQALAQERVLVFAAASLKNALDEVNSAYGRPVSASYAASSALARQIEAGAPVQVFISADVEWMDYLEKKRAVHVIKRRDLLSNRLVWIVPSNAKATSDPLAALGDQGRLALGDPQHVPAGKYARAALEKLGLWSRLSGRIAAAENVRAALALVARGEAPLGIVYRTDALAEPRVKVAAGIEPSLHPPIVYPASLLDSTGAAYFDFLISGKAQAIFARHGFGTP
jgi:molybdate transport system substrate-binding protein